MTKAPRPSPSVCVLQAIRNRVVAKAWEQGWRERDTVTTSSSACGSESVFVEVDSRSDTLIYDFRCVCVCVGVGVGVGGLIGLVCEAHI